MPCISANVNKKLHFSAIFLELKEQHAHLSQDPNLPPSNRTKPPSNGATDYYC
jgi:hypothetical protein